MKKILPIIIVLALIGVGGYMLLNKPDSTTTQTQSATKQASEATEWTKAIASGKPTLCIMTKGEEKMEYLIVGKKMKATISSVVESKKTISYMINDEKFFYVWNEGQTQGTKMPIPSEDEVKQMAENNKQTIASLPETPDFQTEAGRGSLRDSGYAINCSSVNASDVDFVAPNTIKFVDPTAMLKQTNSNNGSQIDMKAIEEMAKQYETNATNEE